MSDESIVHFEKARREGSHVLISMEATSGRGKTFSALMLGRGLVGPNGKLGLLDTETGRGKIYADAIPGGYQYGELTPPYSPERYVAAIQAAASAGLDCLIIDSASHEWEGIGGVGEIAEAGGGRLSVAFQSGNVYLKWGVRTVSDLHKHLFENITRICPPSPNDDDPRILVVRGDGKITAATWSEDLDSIGFVEWETRGDFIFADVCFSAQFVAVLREIDGDNVRFIERIDPAMMLDCVRGSYFPRDPGAATHLAGEAVTVYQDRFFLADLPVAPDGSIAIDGDEFPVTGGSSSVPQIGFPFTSEAAAWPVEMMDAPYVGLKRVRATKFGVSVQGSIHFDMRCNAKSRTVGAYSFGDDLTQAPPVSERIFMAPVTGRPAHHDLAVIRNDPGPWQVLAMTQEVTD